jgi:hypothetical protein
MNFRHQIFFAFFASVRGKAVSRKVAKNAK